MKLNLSKVEFSKVDIKRGIKIPRFLSSSLAELIGTHIGDGNAYQFSSKYGKRRTQISYAGDIRDDYEYYLNCIIPIIKNLFGTEPKLESWKNWFSVRIYSLAIFMFYTQILGLPFGKKANIVKVPEIIFEGSKEIICSFLRGLADTDFSLTFQKKHKKVHYYPIIKIGVASKQLIIDLEKIFTSLEFKVHAEFDKEEYNKQIDKVYIKNYLYLNGKKNLNLWMKLIGFHNPKHLTKYLVWKNFGFCPPKISLKERKSILEGEINPNSFY